MKASKVAVPARIVLVGPPPCVPFALQRGRAELAGITVSTGGDLRFDFTFEAYRAPDGAPRFSGDFVQGPSGGKFVYVTSGTRAGDSKSAWNRRAKVGLQTVTWETVERALAEAGAVLQARVAGTARDGGPACATVPLLDGGWVVASKGE